MDASVNVTDNNSGVLVRTVAVESDGEPYFDCDNQHITFEDLVRLLLQETDDGLAWRIWYD